MTSATTPASTQRAPDLIGKTVVVIGGSAGIGRRQADAPGLRVLRVARNAAAARPSRAAGFVDTPLSASLLEDRLEERRNELRETLPIGRVVGPPTSPRSPSTIMTNTALTGATYVIDGGQQFVS
jgi:hypothetical protein